MPISRLGWVTSAIAIVLVLVGRAVAVYPLSNLFRSSKLAVSFAFQNVLFWGGLRGALGLALALTVPLTVPERGPIILSAFVVVAFSIFVQGLTMPWLVERLGLTRKQRAKRVAASQVPSLVSARVSLLPEPLRIRQFRFFWLARLTWTIGSLAMVIVIGWQVYDIARQTMGLKEAAFRLGIIGLVQFIPLFLLTLVTGWTADRLDRRWIARAAVALELGCASALGWLAWTHTTTLFALYVVAALLGVGRAFAGPALSALAPNLVPREILPRAIALSSIAWQTGAVLGPALGGYLYAYAPYAPYAASGLLFVTAFICLFAIPPVPRTGLARGPNPWAQMVEGLRYVRRNRLVLGAISLDLFAVLLGGATAMLPGLRPRRAPFGTRGAGPPARRASGRRDADRRILFRPAAQAQRRREDARRGGSFRRRNDRIRLVAFDAAVAALPRAAGRGGHVLGLRPPVADPALHARRDARAGRRGFVSFHLGLERARRNRERAFSGR